MIYALYQICPIQKLLSVTGEMYFILASHMTQIYKFLGKNLMIIVKFIVYLNNYNNNNL